MLALFRGRDGSLIFRGFEGAGQPVFNLTSVSGLQTTLHLGPLADTGVMFTSSAKGISTLGLTDPLGGSVEMIASGGGANLTVSADVARKEIDLLAVPEGSRVSMDGKPR